MEDAPLDFGRGMAFSHKTADFGRALTDVVKGPALESIDAVVVQCACAPSPRH